MNYRHAYHAGGFADVVKHAVLCRIIAHLQGKPAAFRVIDTHAGAGMYDLTGPEAGKTGEWRLGIGRLLGDGPPEHRRDALPSEARTLLAPYLDAVMALNPGGLARYPGSPVLAQAMLRHHDRLIACELEPHAAAALAARLRGDPRAKTLALDGWTALTATVPPTERRGLVLVDPPFEQPGEFSRLVQALETAHGKWASGIYLLWYPIKDGAAVAGFIRKLVRVRIPRMLRIELIAATASNPTGLRGSGLIAVNPPWLLHDELKSLLPALAAALVGAGKGMLTLDWLTGEKSR
jgi:23S rRNA (adenine2030-N6)-methyltransferase